MRTLKEQKEEVYINNEQISTHTHTQPRHWSNEIYVI